MNHNHHHHCHHQFLTTTIWIHELYNNCPRSFVKSTAPLSVSPSDVMSSVISSIQRSLCLPLFLFPSNLAGSALRWIRLTGILCTCPNHQSLLNDFAQPINVHNNR